MFSPKCCGLAVLGKVRYMTIADKRQLATYVGNGISTQHVASNSAIYLEADSNIIVVWNYYRYRLFT